MIPYRIAKDRIDIRIEVETVVIPQPHDGNGRDGFGDTRDAESR